jgi:Protein of unknown function (DUF429)
VTCGEVHPCVGGIIDAMTHAAPWLEINEKVRVVCTESDDCLDALICALVARACERTGSSR